MNFILGYFERKRGRNLALLTNAYNDALADENGHGFGSIHANPMNVIGSFLSGKKGTLGQQRAALRRNAGHTPNAANIRATAVHEPNIEANAGAVEALGGAGGPRHPLNHENELAQRTLNRFKSKTPRKQSQRKRNTRRKRNVPSVSNY